MGLSASHRLILSFGQNLEKARKTLAKDQDKLYKDYTNKHKSDDPKIKLDATSSNSGVNNNDDNVEKARRTFLG